MAEKASFLLSAGMMRPYLQRVREREREREREMDGATPRKRAQTSLMRGNLLFGALNQSRPIGEETKSHKKATPTYASRPVQCEPWGGKLLKVDQGKERSGDLETEVLECCFLSYTVSLSLATPQCAWRGETQNSTLCKNSQAAKP